MKFHLPPGATPIEDPSELKIPIATQSQLDALEFDNIYRASREYFRPRKFIDAYWFKSQFLKKIHASMFGEVWKWAGLYRTRNVLPIGVKPYQIASAISELTRDVAHWQMLQPTIDMSVLEMTARIHQRLAWIHPFPNGNGRFSRFVSDLFLFSHRGTLPTWPMGLNRRGVDRQHYLEVLREADKGNFRPLVQYLISLGAKNPH